MVEPVDEAWAVQLGEDDSQLDTLDEEESDPDVAYRERVEDRLSYLPGSERSSAR